MEQLPQKKQELTPSKVDSTKVISNELRILDAQSDKFRLFKDDPEGTNNQWTPIKQELLAQSLRVGIQKPPEVFELVDLCVFISREFKDLNIDEIKKAFSLYQSGKLDFKDSAYNTFSCLFVGNILGAFKRYKRKELALTQSKLPTSFREHPVDSEQYLMDKLYAPYEMLKKGKYLFTNLDEGLLYKKLDRMGLVMATTEQKKEAMIEAKERIQKKYRQNEDEYLKKVKEKAKELCFRNWIENCALEDKDLRTEINKL